MKQVFPLAIIAVLFGVLCGAQKQTVASHTEKFRSPDGMLVAVVRSKHASEATYESRIELRTQTGIVSAERDYTSQDGEHGYGVAKAEWTPDSQFFVYSLESSGGHQAWHSRTWFFSRVENKFISLDDALRDAVTNPQFLVSAPDAITVELQSGQAQTVSLRKITRKLHRTVKHLARYMTDIPQPIPEQIIPPDVPPSARKVKCYRSFIDTSAMIDVVRKCGIPDEHQGSGIYIFLYDMDDGSMVVVGTGDLKRLLYINHIANKRSSSLLTPTPSEQRR